MRFPILAAALAAVALTPTLAAAQNNTPAAFTPHRFQVTVTTAATVDDNAQRDEAVAASLSLGWQPSDNHVIGATLAHDNLDTSVMHLGLFGKAYLSGAYGDRTRTFLRLDALDLARDWTREAPNDFRWTLSPCIGVELNQGGYALAFDAGPNLDLSADQDVFGAAVGGTLVLFLGD